MLKHSIKQKILFMLQIFINRYPFNGTVAFISLPPDLEHSFPQGPNQNPPRVQFQFYSIPLLFNVLLFLFTALKKYNTFLTKSTCSCTKVIWNASHWNIQCICNVTIFSLQSSQEGQILNTFVVSASVTNATSPITNLAEDVKVTLIHLMPNTVGEPVL